MRRLTAEGPRLKYEDLGEGGVEEEDDDGETNGSEGVTEWCARGSCELALALKVDGEG